MRSLGSVLIVFGLWLGLVLGCAAPNQRDAASTAQDNKPKIALLSLRPERSSESHVRLYGELRNISSEPLNNIWVIATFRDSGGAFLPRYLVVWTRSLGQVLESFQYTETIQKIS